MLLQQVGAFFRALIGAFFRGPDSLQKDYGNFPFLGPLPIVAHPHGHQSHGQVQIRTTKFWGQSEQDGTPGYVNLWGQSRAMLFWISYSKTRKNRMKMW